MRKVVVVAVTALLALSMMPLIEASARPSSDRLAVPSLTPVEPDALTTALDTGRLSVAEYALERARTLFRIGSVRREFGAVERPDPRVATFLLRDLSLRLRSLSGAERDQAETILARPTQGNSDPHGFGYSTAEAPPTCTANACIHFVTTTSDQADPAFVAAASSAIEEVWAQEVTAFGWNPPKSDSPASPNGGNGLLDIYLKDLGTGFYGFCANDVGQGNSTSQYAYCVVDNDFAAAQFPTGINGVNALKVTMAHEFNHAIHFGYDVTEDFWWLENIATWMEDEVYDTINDNYNYIEASPLARPQTPADTFKDFTAGDPDSGFQYGGFTWMRYLAEKFLTRDIVLEMFERAAPASGTNLYSLQAISAELEQRDTDFPSSFVDFAARNTDPSLFYEEGAAYETKYTTPVRQASHTLASGAAPVGGQFTNADHLTSRFVSLKPGAGIGGTEQISIAVNLGTAPGQAAAVVNIANNAMTVTEIPLTNGEGTATVSFGGQQEVVLVLSNASTRMTCGGGSFACSGKPVDDNQGHNWAAAVGTTAPDPGDPTGGGGDPGDTEAPVVSGLSASPSTFRANGQNSTVITFSINEAAVVNLKIVNNSGTKVFGLTDRNNVDGPGTYGLRWFGTNNRGRLVPAGKYRIKIKGTDADGNVGATRTTSVTVKR